MVKDAKTNLEIKWFSANAAMERVMKKLILATLTAAGALTASNVQAFLVHDAITNSSVVGAKKELEEGNRISGQILGTLSGDNEEDNPLHGNTDYPGYNPAEVAGDPPGGSDCAPDINVNAGVNPPEEESEEEDENGETAPPGVNVGVTVGGVNVATSVAAAASQFVFNLGLENLGCNGSPQDVAGQVTQETLSQGQALLQANGHSLQNIENALDAASPVLRTGRDAKTELEMGNALSLGTMRLINGQTAVANGILQQLQAETAQRAVDEAGTKAATEYDRN